MTSALDPLLEELAARRASRTPFLVGLTGAVSVGKSTFAVQLAEALAPAGVEVVCTDGFLFDNRTLEARGILGRKGFPESYDALALTAALGAIRNGPADFPGYSHVIYDIDARLARRIAPPDVLIVEGLGLERGPGPLGLDCLIYLDAAEADIEAWYTERFVELWRAAEHDSASFYRRFRNMDEHRARAFAGEVWRMINLPNLREHIGLARDLADVVVEKGADHGVIGVTLRGRH